MTLLGAVGGEDPKPVELTFKGLKTMQTNNVQKSRVLFIDVVQDEHYATLEKIGDMIIRKFLEKGSTTEKELSHVRLNPRTQLYDVKYHLTTLRSERNRTMDATELLSAYGDSLIGQCTLKEVHISSREDFEDADG